MKCDQSRTCIKNRRRIINIKTIVLEGKKYMKLG